MKDKSKALEAIEPVIVTGFPIYECNPSDWHVQSAGEDIFAKNIITGREFEGTREAFCKALRG